MLNREEIKTWSDERLIEEAKQLYISIEICDCFSVSDLCLMDYVTEELNKRGYELHENATLDIVKGD